MLAPEEWEQYSSLAMCQWSTFRFPSHRSSSSGSRQPLVIPSTWHFGKACAYYSGSQNMAHQISHWLNGQGSSRQHFSALHDQEMQCEVKLTLRQLPENWHLIKRWKTMSSHSSATLTQSPMYWLMHLADNSRTNPNLSLQSLQTARRCL